MPKPHVEVDYEMPWPSQQPHAPDSDDEEQEDEEGNDEYVPYALAEEHNTRPESVMHRNRTPGGVDEEQEEMDLFTANTQAFVRNLYDRAGSQRIVEEDDDDIAEEDNTKRRRLLVHEEDQEDNEQDGEESHYARDMRMLDSVPIGDLRIAQDASSYWKSVRPPLSTEQELDTSQELIFEPSSFDYALSAGGEGLVVRMAAISKQGHSCMVKAYGFEPYMYVRKPAKWNGDDVRSFIGQLIKRLDSRMSAKVKVHYDPEYFNKMDADKKKRSSASGGWTRTGSKSSFSADACMNDLEMLRSEDAKATRGLVLQDDSHDASASDTGTETPIAPPSDGPKRRPAWVDMYEYMIKHDIPLMSTTPYNVVSQIERGFSVAGYTHGKSEFIKIVLAYPGLVTDVRRLLENISGGPEPYVRPPAEDWGDADFVQDDEEKAASDSKKRSVKPDRPVFKSRPVKRWLSDDLIQKADNYLEVFNCKIDFCRRFTLDVGIDPECWVSIPAGEYQVIQARPHVEGFRQGAPFDRFDPDGRKLTRDDVTKSFYALPESWDPDIALQHEPDYQKRDSTMQREILVHYKKLRPVAVDADPDLKDCHSRKIYAFGDIETYTGEGGRFSDAKRDDIIAIYFSLYVLVPAYARDTDHRIKIDQSRVDKSTTAGAQQVLEDFVFIVGDILDEDKRKANAHVYSFETCKGMLLAFQRFTVDVDYDEAIMYNGYSFDWPYMMERASVLGVGDLFTRLGRLRGVNAWVSRSTFKSSAHGQMDSLYTNIAMRTQKDPYVLSCKSYKLRSYTLSAVSKYVLNDDKGDMDFHLINEYAQTSVGRGKILHYNKQDVHLLARLVFKAELITYWLEMAVMTHMDVEKVLARGEQARIMSLLFNIAFNERRRENGDVFFFPVAGEGMPYGGAIVQEAQSGYYPPVDDHENQDAATLAPLPPVWSAPDGTESCFIDGIEKALRAGARDGTGIPRLELEDLGISQDAIRQLRDDKGRMIDNVFNHKPKMSKTEIRKLKRGAISTLDFSSMYPSIIIAGNHCSTTLISRQRLEPMIRLHGWKYGVDYVVPPDMCYDDANNLMYTLYPDRSPIFVTPKHREALIVSVIKKLLDLRTRFKKMMGSFPEGSYGHKLNDNRQLLAKIICNSCYGMFGVKQGQFPCTQVASTVTKTGRFMITKTKAFIHHRYSDPKYPCKPEVIYGDSVSEDTPVLVKLASGLVCIRSIGELARKELTGGDQRWTSGYHGTKEEIALGTGDAPILVWTERGFTPIKRIIRHTSQKRMYRVSTHTGIVDVTEDHGLVEAGPGHPEIRAPDMVVGSTNLLVSFPGIDELCMTPSNGRKAVLDLVKIPQTLGEAFSMGLFMSYEPNGTVPDGVFMAREEFRKEFLRGFCMKEGLSPRSSNRCDVRGKVGAMGIFALCRSLGYNASVDVVEGDADAYRITTTTAKYKHCPGAVTKVSDLIDSGPARYVYDLETENHHFIAGVGQLIVHNTDSVFCLCPGLTVLQALVFSDLMAKEMSLLHPRPNKLELEKAYSTFVLYKKKRYAGMKYFLQAMMALDASTKAPIKDAIRNDWLYSSFALKRSKDGAYGTVSTSGIEINRRDSCKLVGKVLRKCTDFIFKENNMEGAIAYVKEYIGRLMCDDIDMSLLIMSRKLNKPFFEYAPAVKGASKKQDKVSDLRNKRNAQIARTAVTMGAGRANGRKLPAQTTKLDRFAFESTPVPASHPTRAAATIDTKKRLGQQSSLKGFFLSTSATQRQGPTEDRKVDLKRKNPEPDTATLSVPRDTDDDAALVTYIRELLCVWNPQAHVSAAMRRYLRNPHDKPASGDRIEFVVVSEYDQQKKGVAISKFCEDPTYTVKKGLGVSRTYYMEKQLMKPVVRFFAPLLDHDPEIEFFRVTNRKGIDSTHLMNKVITSGTASTSKGSLTGTFARLKSCLHCRHPMQPTATEGEDAEQYTPPVCNACSEIAYVAALESTVSRLDQLRAKKAQKWAKCQDCLKTSCENKEIECTNTSCKVLWQRIKVDVDLSKASQDMDRFTTQFKVNRSQTIGRDMDW